jgi:hypothetical protein
MMKKKKKNQVILKNKNGDKIKIFNLILVDGKA